jgi:transglutaminase-like putative cysteine protease
MGEGEGMRKTSATDAPKFIALMNEFLQPTAIIDSDAPSVVALAAELAGDATDDEAVARRCFLWVRDNVRHSSDCKIPTVTCSASEVLAHRVGFCFAKSHLLVALLRARGIPAALCYQRLALDERGSAFCLHGLVAVFLQKHGWYRVDPRGDKAGLTTDFCPPTERLAFTPRLPGESDIPARFADALPSVVATLRRCRTADEVATNLPDYAHPT